MNKQQVKYAMDRIDAIYRHKNSAIKAKHTSAEVRLSPADRFKAFKKGEFTVKPNVKPYIGRYTDITDLVDFKGEKEASENTSAMQRELSALSTEYNRLRDELMLGDAEKALELIKKFEG